MVLQNIKRTIYQYPLLVKYNFTNKITKGCFTELKQPFILLVNCNPDFVQVLHQCFFQFRKTGLATGYGNPEW